MNLQEQKIWSLLQTVTDPEVPVLSVIDLGIIRKVVLQDDWVEIIITPTYSGCPAMDVIAMNIRITLSGQGFKNIRVTSQLSPAWTTDWMSENGKQKLKEFGIAPPNPRQQVCTPRHFDSEEAVQCPHCNSFHSRRVSEFGSTACKALYVCMDCREPFDYLNAIEKTKRLLLSAGNGRRSKIFT